MSKYGLFEGYGIEIEYMIVEKDTLNVSPCADILLEKLAGEPVSEYAENELGYSNELVKHVIELKTDGPAKTLSGLDDKFHEGVSRVNKILNENDKKLMPTAMHPFMNPLTETELWQDESAEIYETYDRIFNCKGHGWSNLQSVHINLPFDGDEQFGKLHAAVRCILPIIPALAASSPYAEGELTEYADSRLMYYMKNQMSVPEVAGHIIPEQVYTEADYQSRIFDVIKNAIAPHDTQNILEPVWLNSRGAIARFDRGAVEIRLLDVQESPQADIAVVKLVTEAVRVLTEKTAEIKYMDEKELKEILLACIKDGENALIKNREYLRLFGIDKDIKAGYIWQKLFTDTGIYRTEFEKPLLNILKNGTLSTRIKRSERDMHGIYEELCSCLLENRLFYA